MDSPKEENSSMLKAFGDKIVKMGSKYRNLVVLDGGYSTVLKTDRFEKIFSERHFNFGFSEQNMIGVAAGMSLRGKLPFVCSYAGYITGRAWEPIRNALCIPNLNVKIMGSHVGLLSGEDGPIHQALEDIAIMRTLTNMKIVSPADAIETELALEEILNDYGPTYIRLPSQDLPNVYGASHEFKLGHGDFLMFGQDITLVATGSMVNQCLLAAQKLKHRGFTVSVLNMSTIKPLDEKLLLESAKNSQTIITVEDHNTIGGLGSAVKEYLSEYYPKKIHSIGMDKFAESGSPEGLYRKYGLNHESIFEYAINIYDKERR